MIEMFIMRCFMEKAQYKKADFLSAFWQLYEKKDINKISIGDCAVWQDITVLLFTCITKTSTIC